MEKIYENCLGIGAGHLLQESVKMLIKLSKKHEVTVLSF